MTIEATTDATAPDTTPTDLPATDTSAVADDSVSTDEPAVSPFRAGVDAIDPSATADTPIPSPPMDAADVSAAAKDKLAAVAAAVEPVVADPSKPAPVVTGQAKQDADTAEDDAEIAGLGVKNKKAGERFREMKAEIRESAPMHAMLKERQISDPQMLERALEQAQHAESWDKALADSTATPEQMGAMLNVVKAMNGDDPALLKACYDNLMNTVNDLGKRIGITNGDDPMEGHPDLKAAVENMDITLEYAQEIMQQRAAEMLRQSGQQRQANARQQTEQQATHITQARDTAIAGIDELSNTLKARDPDFTAKLAIITPMIRTISETYPPHEWVQRIAQEYAVARVTVAAPVSRVRPGHVPTRPSSPAGALHAEPTRENAFRMGVDSIAQG